MALEENKPVESAEQKQENIEAKQEAKFENPESVKELAEQKESDAKEQVQELTDEGAKQLEHANDSIGLATEQAETIKKSEGVDQKMNEMQKSAQAELQEFQRKIEENVAILLDQAVIHGVGSINVDFSKDELSSEQKIIMANAFSKNMERLQVKGNLPLNVNFSEMSPEELKVYASSPETKSLLAKLDSERATAKEIDEMEKYMGASKKEIGSEQATRLEELKIKYPNNFLIRQEKMAVDKLLAGFENKLNEQWKEKIGPMGEKISYHEGTISDEDEAKIWEDLEMWQNIKAGMNNLQNKLAEKGDGSLSAEEQKALDFFKIELEKLEAPLPEEIELAHREEEIKAEAKNVKPFEESKGAEEVKTEKESAKEDSEEKKVERAEKERLEKKASEEKLNKPLRRESSESEPVLDRKALFDRIDAMGGVQGTQKFYSAEELKKIVAGVLDSRNPEAIREVTRTGGLRNMVADVFKSEANIDARKHFSEKK